MDYKIINKSWNTTINWISIISFSLYLWGITYYREGWGKYTADASDSKVYLNGKLKTNF